MPRACTRRAAPPRRPFGAFAAATPILLAGLLPLHPEVSDRWGWSGTWLHPVGDPYAIAADSAGDDPSYRVMRGVSDRAEPGHQGADLSNGRGGGPVRAAANGLVVQAGGKGWNHGYGGHVVLAHRLADGALVYSVYAHLAPGSVTVQRGQFVSAGRVIGKVGMTGRATSPHLHFEVRNAGDPAARWENLPAQDPLAFVAARLASPRADSLWARPYLEWAECAALIRPGAPGDRTPSRAEWWRTLAAATQHSLGAVPVDDESLRVALIAMGLLPESSVGDKDTPLVWGELARDLHRARDQGLRLPWSPVELDRRRLECRRRLGLDSLGSLPAALAQAEGTGPSRAQVCLALAELAGDAPRRAKPQKHRTARSRRGG